MGEVKTAVRIGKTVGWTLLAGSTIAFALSRDVISAVLLVFGLTMLALTPNEGVAPVSRSVALTGHRRVSAEQGRFARRALTEIAADLYAADPDTEAISGLALGADTVWADIALATGMRLAAYVPFEAQADQWTSQQQDHWRELRARASREVVVGGEHYDVRMLHARNAAMIADCELLLAVWSPSVTTGGTASAVAKARRSGRRMVIIDLDQFKTYTEEPLMSDTTLFDNGYVRVDTVPARTASGVEFDHSRVHARSGFGVVVVVVFRRRGLLHVGLIEQDRPVVGGRTLEFPRGAAASTDDTDQALAELREEMGVQPLGQIERIGTIRPDTGLLASAAGVYLARVDEAADGHREDESNGESLWVDWGRFEGMVRQGEIECGFTLAATALLTLSGALTRP